MSSNYVEETFLSEDELIDRTSKSRNLNGLKFKVDKLFIETDDARVKSKLASMISILEDAYKIDMYKFQFKAFVLSIGKEIKNLEEYVGINNAIWLRV